MQSRRKRHCLTNRLGRSAAVLRPPGCIGRARGRWAQNGAHGTVLVIEGVLASGAQLTSAAKRARAASATRVVGAAVIAEPNGLASCRKELGDEIHALRELALAS